MGHSLLVGLACLVVALMEVKGYSCPTILSEDCYFENVATIRPTKSDPNGYFVVGGLFDIHQRGANAIECSSNINEEGLINMLAFFWGVDSYKKEFVDGSVGAVAFDNCYRPEQTIENMLGFAQCKIKIQSMEQQNMVAYVGPYRDMDVKSTAQLATDIGVTVVSPGADAVDISFPNTTLLRTSPSFRYDLDAMVGFLSKVESKYAIVLYDSSDHSYEAAHSELMTKLKSINVCVSYDGDVSEVNMPTFVSNHLESVVDQKFVFPLMSKEKFSELLDAISKNDRVDRKLRFILNSHIGKDLRLLTKYAEAAKDAIVVTREIGDEIKSEVDSFVKSIHNWTDFNDPLGWVATYRAKKPGFLTFDDDTPSRLTSSIARTLLSVKAIMKGMKNRCSRTSQLDGACRNQDSKENRVFVDIKESVPGLFGENNELSDKLVNYTYYHFENPLNGDVRFTSIGYFRNGASFGLEVSDPAFAPGTCTRSDRCCIAPTTKAPTTPQAPITTATLQPMTSPKQLPYSAVYYKPDEHITGAYPYVKDDDRGDWNTRFDDGDHKWIIALGVLAGLGILCVLVFEIYILFKLLGTRLGHQWRTMWLGQLLLFGIFLGYLTLFAYLFTPTKETCGIIRFGVGVSYAFCFAVLLVKLMVILTSKTSDVLLPGDESPNYLKGVYQFLMFIFAVGVQVVIDVQWLIIVPPEAVEVTSNNGDKVYICNHYTWEASKGMTDMSEFVRTNFENHVLSLVYIMVLILITTILSLNAHGIITNHRESVFIGISAGFSIPIWLAWTLVGGLNDDHSYAQEFGDACIAFGLFATLTLILFAMFLPKVRQLVNMGVEGIYLEDDRDTYYAGSVIMAPPSFKKGPPSVVFVNNQGIYSEPVVVGNGDPTATYLKHPGSTYSAPPATTYQKRPESAYGSTRVLRVTDDLKGRHPQSKRAASEVAYGTGARPRSHRGTLPRSRSGTDLGAL